jgi:multicomponent Na+:H+ antiporter subunit D
VIAVAVVMSFLTLYSMIKIWNQAFWKASPEQGPASGLEIPSWKFQILPVIILTLLIVALGLFPEPVFQIAEKAAYQILAPAEYIGVIFGGGN